MSGKGSGRRPGEGHQDNFSRIFGEKKRGPYTPPPIDAAQKLAQDNDSINPLGATMREGTGIV